SNLRLMLISDIHLSPFLSERELARIVEMANDCKPHITFVTGDLISNPGDPLDACLRQLARLKSDAGVYGCLGNHEFFARADEHATREGARLGIQFLRQARTEFRFGGARLSVAGVDYQRKDRPYLPGAEALISPGAVNLLLSHNPDVFPVAAKLGFQAVLAGHTHGGQVSVEILDQHVNVARFFTPYVYGIYREPNSAIYVTRGVGTIGMPVRVGAPPEIALIRLCAT
ncbi:MAG: metallophosphoesterase, partial [Bryobacteraceae bacterium]|nr:metallophosphoesterase [Bryobacteraceae bacterium]